MSRSVNQPASTGEDLSVSGKRLGKYVVADVLGRGGMGVVYEAVDTILHRRVALKVLLPSISADAASLQQFVREARAAARLNHPNVVSVYDCSQQDDLHFIVMELVRGGNLHDELKRSGPMTWSKATAVVIDACRGLVSAHQAGLVHRDIKPSNLLRAADGTVKLADFGLSKTARATGLTVADVVVGTPDYMSPEQCRGESADAQSDVYALGATYFALLTGRAPYDHPSALRVLYAHCSQPVPNPRSIVPDLPTGCSAVIRRAMAKEPADRFASAVEFLHALENLLADPPGKSARSRDLFLARPEETLRIRNADTPRQLERVPRERNWMSLVSKPNRFWAILAVAAMLIVGGAILARWPAGNTIPLKSAGPKSGARNVGAKLAPATAPAMIVVPGDAVGPFPIAGMTAARKPEKIAIKRRTVKVGLAATAVAFSTQGDRLAVAEYNAGAGSEVHVWNSHGEKVGQRHLKQMVSGLAFRPGSDSLAIASSRGEGVVLWQPSDRTSLDFPVATPLSNATTATFSPDGAVLAYAMNLDTGNGVVELWNVNEHRRLLSLKRHRGAVTGVQFVAGESGELLVASSDSDGQVLLSNAQTGTHVRALKAAGSVTTLSISRDRQKLAAAATRGIEIWDMAHPGQPPNRLAVPGAAARQAVFLGETQQVAWTVDQEVHVVPPAMAEEQGGPDMPLTIGPTDGLPLAMAATPAQLLVAVVSREGILSLWEFPRIEAWKK